MTIARGRGRMSRRGQRIARIGLRTALVGALCLGLAACQTQVRHHGYAPDDAALAQIQIGRDDREAVAAAIGRPGTVGLLRDSGWFYVGSRWEQRGWNAPVEVERELVAVSFDSRGVVSNIERFGLADGQVVPLSRRVTEDRGAGTTLVQQLLRNIGRFTTGTIADEG
jgi:outer membrane protein assembly factor BamE (lipoprotein component of BamABCDE complex)